MSEADGNDGTPLTEVILPEESLDHGTDSFQDNIRRFLILEDKPKRTGCSRSLRSTRKRAHPQSEQGWKPNGESHILKSGEQAALIYQPGRAFSFSKDASVLPQEPGEDFRRPNRILK